MTKRVCRDCPVPGCGAKYLVRLANHLADVHLLDIDQRRKYLQEAKLQPKIKFAIYQNTTEQNSADNTPAIEQQRVYALSQPRQHHIGKANRKKGKHRKATNNRKVCGELKNWLIIE